MQLAVAPLRRPDAADDPLKTKVGVIEDELDRFHALGGSPRDRAAATDKLGQLPAQHGLQVLHKPHGEAATFARRQAQPRVLADGPFDATAYNLAIATGMRPAVPPGHQRRAVAIAAFPSVVLLYRHAPSKPQCGEELNSGVVTRL